MGSVSVPAAGAVTHGSLSEAELASLGFQRDQVIDFSVSLNPLGPSPRASAAVPTVDVARYPEDGTPALRRALAARCGVECTQVITGNGASELLWLLALATLGPGRPALVVGPAYGEYGRACRIAGAEWEEWRAREEEGFRFDVPAIEQRIRERRPALTFLCNPNNPTGTLLSGSDILRLAAAHADGLLLVDEAYLPFVESAAELAPRTAGAPLVLARSLTKIYSLPGLRLGYLVAAPAVIAAIDRLRPPWSVNAVAEAAGLAALDDAAYLARTLPAVQEARRYLSCGLAALNLPPLPGAANFLLVRVGNAAALRARLLQQGICVRDCSSFGLPAYIRVGVRPKPDCARLLAALEQVQ